MAKPQKREQPPKMQPPMAPMIDIIFQLLLFFILMPTNVGGDEGYLTTNLPTHTGPNPGRREKLLYVKIGLKHEGPEPECPDVSIILNDNQVFGANFDQLYAALMDLRAKGLAANQPVLISPTMATRHKWVVKAFDAAVAARFTDIHFAVPYE